MVVNKATSSCSVSTTGVSSKRFQVDKPNESPNNESLSAELYGLGRIIKRTQPPGGSESGVYDAFRSPSKELSTRKNVKTIYKSHIFRDIFPPTPRQVTSSVSDVSLERPYVDKAKDYYKCSPSNKSLNAELYGLGKTLRHLQPPGGTESGVFDAYRKPLKEPARKNVKDRFRSCIFQDPCRSPPHRVTPLKKTTLYKIFQKTPSPRKRSLRNKFESTAFKPDPPMKPMKVIKVKRDPITGCNCKITDGEMRCKKYNVRNPITFEGVIEKDTPSRFKQPPGGTSSLVLEYDETPRPF